MRTEYITIGSEINTIYGYEKVTGYSDRLYSVDSYEADDDGNCTMTRSHYLTAEEIQNLMKEVDGRNHKVQLARIWYAVQADADDNDWGDGSYDLEEAKAMAADLGPEARIAVIQEGNDPICIEEILLDHIGADVVDDADGETWIHVYREDEDTVYGCDTDDLDWDGSENGLRQIVNSGEWRNWEYTDKHQYRMDLTASGTRITKQIEVAL
jgi:hypothetical protein